LVLNEANSGWNCVTDRLAINQAGLTAFTPEAQTKKSIADIGISAPSAKLI